MTAETLYDDFISMFPDDIDIFRNQEAEMAVGRDTMLLLFSMVVCPYLHRIVKHEPEKARKAFDFLEQMELSDDSLIVSIAEIGVLETIMTDGDGSHMKKILPYLGKESLKSIRYMAQFYNLKPF